MTGGRRRGTLTRKEWTADQLEQDRQTAIRNFRRTRLEEPLEEYHTRFDALSQVVSAVLTDSGDLSRLDQQAMAILSDPAQLEVFRYLAGPPISLDDLKVLVDAPSISSRALEQHPDLVRRLIDTIRAGLDRRRFPWVPENRTPTTAEFHAAVISSAALIASQRLATSRRSAGKREQEQRVREALLAAGFDEVSIPGNQIRTLAMAPAPGEFCQEAMFGERKADLIVGLWDRRFMPIECKVSNSSTNSVKRLNNDAAVKAGVWIHDFGTFNVVPVAVLSGVFKLHNLLQAQERGLTLYWAHRLSDLTDWIEEQRGKDV